MPYLEGESKDHMSFSAGGLQCSMKDGDERCDAVELEITLGLKHGIDTAKVDHLISYRGVEDEIVGNTLVLRRFVFLEGGISRANLKANFNMFFLMANAAWDKLEDAEYLS